MSGIYVQLANELKKLTQDVTADEIKKALGYTPASQESVDNVLNDESAELYITDKNGNIIALFDKEGLHTTEVEVGEFKVKEHIKDGDIHTTADDKQKWNDGLEAIDEISSQQKEHIEDGDMHVTAEDKQKWDTAGVEAVSKHSNDAVIHITAEERAAWNNKSDLPNIVDDESDSYYITDENGNIIFMVDKEGVHTTKVNGKDVAGHIDDGVVHITASERQKWNNKSDFDGSYNSLKDLPDLEQGVTEALNVHTSNKENPHGVTKSQIGLGNVNNTADSDKPVSTAQQSALDNLQKAMSEQIVSDAKSLTVSDGNGNVIFKVDDSGAQTTELTLVDGGSVVNVGDKLASADTHMTDTVAHITSEERAAWNNKSDFDGHYESLTGRPDIPDFTNVYNHIDNKNNPHAITKAQIGLDKVENTSDIDKPVSSATQEALNNLQKTMSEQLVSESDSWTVVDGNGNIVASVDKDGLHTIAIYVNGMSVMEQFDFKIQEAIGDALGGSY